MYSSQNCKKFAILIMLTKPMAEVAHLSCNLTQSTWHLKIQVPGAGTWHLAHHLNLASGVSLKRAFKMLSRNACFRLQVHSLSIARLLALDYEIHLG